MRHGCRSVDDVDNEEISVPLELDGGIVMFNCCIRVRFLNLDGSCLLLCLKTC